MFIIALLAIQSTLLLMLVKRITQSQIRVVELLEKLVNK